MFVLLAFVPGHSLWAGLRSTMFGIFGASLYLIGAIRTLLRQEKEFSDVI